MSDNLIENPMLPTHTYTPTHLTACAVPPTHIHTYAHTHTHTQLPVLFPFIEKPANVGVCIYECIYSMFAVCTFVSLSVVFSLVLLQVSPCLKGVL